MDAAPAKAPDRALKNALLVGLLISGMSGLIYEVAWTRELSLIFGSTVYAVALMLTAYMAGLSLGGFLGGRIADKAGTDLVALFVRLEFGIGVFSLLTIPIIRALPALYFWINSTFVTPSWLFFAIQLVLAFLVMAIPTTLMGATFPVASKLAARAYRHLGELVGTLYSVNTLGSIFGSAAAGFVLIPAVGVRGAILIAAFGNFVVAVLLRRTGGQGIWTRWAGAAVGVLSLGLVMSAVVPDPSLTMGFALMARFMDYDTYRESVRTASVVFEEQNEYGRVAVLEYASGSRVLVNGGFIEGSNEAADSAMQQALALVPQAYSPDAEDALVVGLGTGYTSQAMLERPLDRVDTVEINPAVATASGYFVGNTLTGDPRWKLHVDDARQYIATHEGGYDIISSEPSWPLSTSVANLFTLESFESMADIITEDGVSCQWVPKYLLSKRDFQILYRTYSAAFPNVDLWSIEVDGQSTDEILMIGTKTGGRDLRAIEKAVNEGLTAAGVQGARVLPFEAPKTTAQALEDPEIPLNTDDRPVFEFGVVNSFINRIEQLSE